MGYNGPRVPLNMQKGGMEKAVKKNPSYESARANQIHEPQYEKMTDRAGVADQTRIRRYPNGELDYRWVMLTIVDAIHKAESGMYLTPVEESLLTVFFPLKFQKVESAQAEIRTQLSSTEKAYLEEMVERHIKEEMNYNAGRGGGSVEGRGRTLTE
jgi:hypothetical protein